MLTMGRTLYPDYVGAQQIRQDYFRRDVLGGVGEGAWGAVSSEILVNGAVAAVTFAFGPPAAQSFVIDKVIIGLICLTAPGTLEFGNIGNPLANGIIFRIYRTAGIGTGVPETTNLFTILSNSDLMRFGQRNLQDDGVNAFFNCVWTPVSADMPMVLHGTQAGATFGDRLQLIVQDNLTGFGGTTMWALCHAHVLS